MRNFLVLSSILFGAAIMGCQGGGGNVSLSGAVVDARDLGFFVESIELDDLGCPPSDLTGKQLLITDGSGNTLGTATLDKSDKIHATEPPEQHPEYGYRILCAYRYNVTVPSAEFYTLSLPDGTSITYPKDEVINGPASLLVTR